MLSKSIHTTLVCLTLSTTLGVAGCKAETDTSQDQPTGGFPTGGWVRAEVPERDDPEPDPVGCEMVPDGLTLDEVDEWLAVMRVLTGSDEGAREQCPLLEAGDPEPIQHSSDEVGPPDPASRWAWISATSHTKLPIAAATVAALPCGEGALGLVLCGTEDVSSDETGFFVVTMILGDALPLDAPDFYGQYAAVFDMNGSASDNYEASPEYPNDLFQNTDRWIEVGFYPGEPPWLLTTDTTTGVLGPIPSAARVIVGVRTITFIVPASEAAIDCPGHRMTAFTHHGDYGFESPNFWAGDTEPTVNEALEAVCAPQR